MPRVVYSAKARDDMANIWLWIALNTGVATADAVLSRMEHRIAMLADNPALGPARSDLGEAARHLVCERWLALYRVSSDRVEVVRVVDGTRDMRRLPLG